MKSYINLFLKTVKTPKNNNTNNNVKNLKVKFILNPAFYPKQDY